MGKSFVSMYTPRPPGDVRLQVGRFMVSTQLMNDYAALAEREMDNLVHDLAYDMRESRENGHIGPMHRPTRSDYRAIERAAWRRLDLQRRLARMGKPAGEFRRANNCDGETCPLGQAREFYNRESGEMVCAGCWR